MRVCVSFSLVFWLLSSYLFAGDEASRFQVVVEFPGIARERVSTLKDVWGSYLAFHHSSGRASSSFHDVPAGDFHLRVELPNGDYIVKSFRVDPAAAGKNREVKLRVSSADLRATSDSLQSANAVSLDELEVPRKARDRFAKAWKEMQNANWQKAREHFEEAVEIAPAYFDAWNNLGVVARKQNDLACAEQCFRRALEIRPASFEALYNLSEILGNTGRYGEAIRYARMAQRLRPQDPRANAQLGAHLFHANRYGECVEYLTRAAQEDPKSYYFPQLLLAVAFENLQRPVDAVEQLEHWLKHHPGNPQRNVVEAKLRQLTTSLDNESDIASQ